jgi:hypothetical protein
MIALAPKNYIIDTIVDGKLKETIKLKGVNQK